MVRRQRVSHFRVARRPTAVTESFERCQLASRRDRRMERLCSPERSTMARWNVCWSIGGYLHRNAPETPRTLSTVELGVHKLSPGILTHEYCRPERTIATIRCHEQTWGLESGSRRQARQNETESRRVTALSKVEVGVPDSGPLRPSPTPERFFAP